MATGNQTRAEQGVERDEGEKIEEGKCLREDKGGEKRKLRKEERRRTI